MLNILHLSDLHIEESFQNNELVYPTKIVNAVLPLLAIDSDLLIVVTGDIAQSGKAKEYENAIIFFKTLNDNFFANRINSKFWFSPGNHDCDFAGPGHVRDILLSSIQKDKNKIDDEVISALIGVQKNYTSFVSMFEKHSQLNSLLVKYENTFNGLALVGHSLNTSWMSQIKENIGTLRIPGKFLERCEENCIRICFFHHTLNWFEPHAAREIQDYIKMNFDVALSGHEHTPNSYKRIEGADKLETHFIEGGVLFEHSTNKSSFNILIVNPATQSFEYTKFEYDEKEQIYRESVRNQLPFIRTKHQQLQKFQINDKTNEWLDDMGYSFQHSQKDPINLSDVFTCPDFDEIANAGKSKKGIKFKSDNFFSEHEVTQRLIIVGPKESGKTSLGKRLYIHHRDRDRVVLYLKGSKLNRRILADGNKLFDQLQVLFAEQYVKFDNDLFKQMPLIQRAIIIDDFHLSELNYQGKQKLLNALSNIFGFIVVLADEVFKYEELMTGSSENNVFDLFKLISIRPFGKRLKNQLIKKWTLLGRENELEFKDWIKFQEHLLERLESVLENKAIVSYPIYILTLLQQIEAGTPAAAMSGSHGYLYDYLIHAELRKSFSSASLINSIDNYLSHFCYWYFQNSRKSISIEEFHKFHSQYVTDFGSTLRPEWVLKHFENAGIFNVSDSAVSVRRKYYTVYYASVRFGELLTDHNSDALKGQLEELIKRIYLEDISSFFSCLFYQTTSKMVRDVVMSYSKTIFNNLEPFNFDGHVNHLTEVGYELFSNILDVDDEDIEKNRETAIESQDSKNAHADEKITDSDFEKNDTTSVAIQINIATKMMHILGQMLKAHQGKVSREEQKIVSIECFDVGLRTLHFISDFIRENKEQILKSSQEIFIVNEGSAEALVKAKKFLYLIMQAISTSFVERIASSVGAEELQIIFKDVITEKGGIGYSLIDFSINLTYKKDFPIEYLFDQATSYEKKPFAYDALRLSVIKHLHLNPVDYRKKSQIAEKLKLTTKTMQKALTSSKN